MKIKVICQQCFHKGYLSESNLFEKIILQESTLYHFRCKHQHDNLVLLQAFKFEILFESGLCAINDKYYLEAVLSLTASLERFYEFAIKILSTGNGLSFDDFEKLQFQVGKIISCEEVKKSKKLLCSQVQIGSQVRQIVSGIKAHYSAEEMVGKRVMVVTNLKPAKLAGILSEGMILCAEDADGNLSLMVPEKEMPAGAEIC